MGTIVEMAKIVWGDYNKPQIRLAKEIESQFDALRQEIQGLKHAMRRLGHDLSQEIQVLKDRDFIIKEPAPESDLQRGDFMSYISKGGTKKIGEKAWGIFYHRDGCRIWGYWEQFEGGFGKSLGFMPRDQVTFEFRPEK